MIISEQLCLAGFERAQLVPVRQAHAALVRIDGHANVNGAWIAVGQDYEALRNALQVYERQLRIAPPMEVRMAQTVMVTTLAGRDVAVAGI